MVPQPPWVRRISSILLNCSKVPQPAPIILNGDKMKLSKEDVELFYKLYHSLWIYSNKQLNILKGLNSIEDIKKFDFKDLNKLRVAVYKKPDLIDLFIKENKFNLTDDEINILRSWKHFVQGTFYVFRYMKDCTIFLVAGKTPKAYGVYALNSSFQEMIGPYLPVAMETVLLPFKNKIIYDSIFSPYPISFGGGIRRNLNNTYQEAKMRFGIITTLPFLEKEVDKLDELKAYLSTKDNIEQYADEINKLIKDPELFKVYYQEMGKKNSTSHKKQLRSIGIRDCWFAIFFDTIVASGKTKESVEQAVKDVLPEDKREFVHIFRL